VRTETATEIQVSLPYLFEPRSYQWAVWDAWDAGVRRFCEVWHRRSGKDKTFLNFCVERMLERKGNYLHVFPKQNQGRRIIWTGIDREGHAYLDHFPPELLYRAPNNSDMLVTLIDPTDRTQPGSTYQVLGTDRNLDAIVGANPVGIIFSEFALQNPRAWDLARPILRENGGWAAFITTPRGKNHAYRLYGDVRNNPDWHVSVLSTADTRRDAPGESGAPVVSEADIEADRAEGMTQDLIDQEYGVSWEAAIPGAYYAQEFRAVDQERRITRVPYDPTYPVYTFWDIGVDDHTAIWCAQFVGRQICLLHYYENSGFGLPHYATYLKELPYAQTYRAHFLPHDGRVREWGTGERRQETADRLLPGQVEISYKPSFADGISAVRTMFPRLLFDAQGCERGIEALRSYHHEWDEQRRVFRDQPEHDWASHGSDALRTLATSLTQVDKIEKQWQGKQPAPEPEPEERFITAGRFSQRWMG
jgi:phage terminase large subunit